MKCTLKNRGESFWRKWTKDISLSWFHKGQLRPSQSNKSNSGANAGTLPLKRPEGPPSIKSTRYSRCTSGAESVAVVWSSQKAAKLDEMALATEASRGRGTKSKVLLCLREGAACLFEAFKAPLCCAPRPETCRGNLNSILRSLFSELRGWEEGKRHRCVSFCEVSSI